MDVELWSNIATIIALPISILSIVVSGTAIYKINFHNKNSHNQKNEANKNVNSSVFQQNNKKS